MRPVTLLTFEHSPRIWVGLLRVTREEAYSWAATTEAVCYDFGAELLYQLGRYQLRR